jgi:hypothetical protein
MASIRRTSPVEFSAPDAASTLPSMHCSIGKPTEIPVAFRNVRRFGFEFMGHFQIQISEDKQLAALTNPSTAPHVSCYRPAVCQKNMSEATASRNHNFIREPETAGY